jgi:hypothetical protein
MLPLPPIVTALAPVKSPSEAFHVDTMLRAAWQKLRLARVEDDLTRTLLAESALRAPAVKTVPPKPSTRGTRAIRTLSRRQVSRLPQCTLRSGNDSGNACGIRLRRLRLVHPSESSDEASLARLHKAEPYTIYF